MPWSLHTDCTDCSLHTGIAGRAHQSPHGVHCTLAMRSRFRSTSGHTCAHNSHATLMDGERQDYNVRRRSRSGDSGQCEGVREIARCHSHILIRHQTPRRASCLCASALLPGIQLNGAERGVWRGDGVWRGEGSLRATPHKCSG